jgi:CRP-like cAMP-binding protein
MYLKQGDLFWGMDKDFVKEAMDTTTKQNPNEGDLLFREGDSADYFYILIKGRVKLSIGETGKTVYMARHPGEIIGWSSMIGRDAYSASAECMEDANILKVNCNDFLKALAKDPANEAILFKRVAEMLGNRLLEVYPSIA